MRLTCPNCGAQYEVPDDVIPQAGRDVQCSNCGDTWFQTHRDHTAPEDDASTAPDDREEDAPDTPEPAAPEPAPEPAPDNPDEIAEPAETAPDDVPSGAPAITPEPAPGTPDPTERPGRREIDPAVANLLREEAEREKRARAAAQSGGLETQPDLGLPDSHDEDRRSREARARMSHLRGDDSSVPASQDHEPEGADPQDIDPISHRSLFPDIEEINSSLAPGATGARTGPDHTAYPEASGRRGQFRSGFLLAALIAVAALLAYVFAPQLADMVPALREVLGEYVGWVNGLRRWLDGQITALMLWLDSMASTAPASSGDPATN